MTLSDCEFPADHSQYQLTSPHWNSAASTTYTGWPKKVSHHQFFKKIVLKIAYEIRFLRKDKSMNQAL